MTQEKKILISPQDILAVGHECPHCKSTHFVPINKMVRIIALCPNCQQRLMSETQPSSGQLAESVVFSQFLEALKAMQVREFGNHIRLEIKADASTPLASQKSGQAQ